MSSPDGKKAGKRKRFKLLFGKKKESKREQEAQPEPGECSECVTDNILHRVPKNMWLHFLQ